MLQLSKQLGTMCLLVVLIVLGNERAPAKCISLRIALDGEIVEGTSGLTVMVEVPSKTKGDVVTHVSQSYSTDRTHFRIVAWFDTTSNLIRKETCNRDPALVIVKLMDGKQVLDRQTLPIETAFRRTKNEDFELLKPLNLTAKKKK